MPSSPVRIAAACVATLLLGAFAPLAHAQVNMVASSFTSDTNPAPAGATFTYTFVVYNSGNQPADGVLLSVPIDSRFQYGASYTLSGTTYTPGSTCAYSTAAQAVQCALGTVAADPTLSNPIQLTVTVTDTAPGPFVASTTATVSTSSAESNTTDNSQTLTETVTVGADLALTSHAGAPNPVEAAGTLTYTINGSNNGPNSSTNDIITETLPSGVTYQSASGSGWSCANSGQLVSCTRPGPDAIGALPTVTVTGKVSSPSSGTVTATAAISSSTVADGVPNNNVLTADVTITPGTDVAISQSVSPNPAAAGLSISFDLMPRNLGPQTASNVTVTDTLPGSYSSVAASGSGWSCSVSGETVTCTASSLAVAASNDITITALAPASVPAGGLAQTNTAVISTSTPDPVPSNNSSSASYTVLPAQSDLTITKTKTPNPVASGSTLTSVLQVRNLGPLATSASIPLTDVLPAGEDYSSYNPGASGWTCSYTLATRTVSCSLPGGLAVGASTPSLSILTTATGTGTLTNNACTGSTAGFTGTDIDAANDCASASSSSTAAHADLIITKSVNTTDLAPTAQTVTYTLLVTNNGPATSTGVVVRDDLSSGGSAIAINGTTGIAATAGVPSLGSAAGTCGVSNSVVTCNYPQLVNGETATITVAVSRPMHDGTFTNTATVTSTGVGDPNAANNSGSIASTIEPVADVAVTSKTVTPSTVQAGVNATYVISVQNLGPSTANAVTVTDVFTLPSGDAGFTLISANATGGGSCNPSGLTIACSWSQLANNATQSVTIVIRPNYEASPPAGGRVYSNTATVSESTYDSNSANNAQSATLTITQALLDIIALDTDVVDPVGFQPPSSTITYKVSVLNNGPSYGTGVSFTDKLTPPAGRTITFLCDKANAGDSCPPATALCSAATPAAGPGVALTTSCNVQQGALATGDLPAGSTFVRYLDFSVMTAPSGSGDTYVNTAVATSNEPDSNLANNTAVKNTTVLPSADLQVTSKIASAAAVYIEQPFTWTISLTNGGPSAGTQPRVLDTLPSGMVLTGAPVVSPSPVQPCQNGSGAAAGAGDTSFTCYLAALAVNGTATIVAPVRITSYSGSYSNSATIDTQGYQVDPVSTNNTSTGSVSVLKNSVTATVFSDTNHDGAQQGGENGISGITFRLSGTDTYGNAVSVSATSNSNGQVTFDNLANSNASGYAIQQSSATPAGFEDGVNTAGSANGSAGAVGTNVVNAIVLTGSPSAGVAATGYLFAKVPLSSLAGTVYSDTNGNGALDAGEPGVAGVVVTLTGTDFAGNAVSLQATTVAGAYSFTALAPANATGYTLTMTTPANWGLGKATAGSAGGTAAAGPSNTISAIHLGGATSGTGYNFALTPAAIDGVVYVDANRNGVKDPGELGYAGGATVQLLDSTSTVVATVTTGVGGAYAFNNLKGGSYTVQLVTPAGYGAPPNQGVTAVPGTVSVANFGITTSTLIGLVYFDANGNGVRDAGEAGLAGVTLTLSGTDAGGHAVSLTTTTDSTGSYVINSVVAGSYALAITQPPLYAPGVVTPGSFGGTAGPTVSGITVPVAQSSTAYTFAEIGTPINGVVFLDANRNGLEDGGDTGKSGVTVTLKNGANVVVATATSAADGSFSFPNLLGGSYTVIETVPAGYSTSTASSQAVTLVAGTAANLLFGLTSSTLSGSVYNDANNNGARDAGEFGIPNVTVTLTGTDVTGAAVSQSALTDASGNYRFAALLTGSYTLTETQPAAYTPGRDAAGTFGGNSSVTDVISGIAVTAGADGPGYLFAQRGTAIVGVVFLDANRNGLLDGTEGGVAGVTITLKDGSGNVLATTTSAANGSFTFTSLAAGTYSVVVTPPPGYGTSTATTVSVGLATNAAANVPFGLTASTLSGSVYVDANNNASRDAGEPGLQGVTVTLSGTALGGASVSQTTTTDANGNYSFAALLGGTYSLSATPPATYAVGRNVAGNEGGTVSGSTIGSIVLPVATDGTGYLFAALGAAVSGMVYVDANKNGALDAGEAGVAGTTVQLLNSANQIVATTQTDASGAYHFTSLPAGAYTVVASPSRGYLTETAASVAVTVGVAATPTVNFGVLNGSLSGAVFLDGNGNGVRDAGEQGLAGVTITLTGTDALGNAVSRAAQTDASGNYQFSALLAGSYALTVTQPAGYSAGASVAGSAGGTSAAAPSRTIPAINLGAGVNGTGYLFAELGDAVAGTVFIDVNANGVQDPTDPGLAGVQVTLNSAGGGVVASTTTDANGHYLFAGVIAGNYTLTETPPAGYGQSTPVSVPVTVTAGAIVPPVNFGESTGSLAGFVFADSNGDGARQNTEPGVEAVTITLTGTDAAGVAVSRTTQTDVNGNFLFSGLRAGTYALSESQPAGYRHGVATPGTSGGQSAAGTLSAIVLGSAVQATGYRFAELVSENSTISGSVWLDDNHDGRRDASDPGVAGVTVELVEGGSVVATAVTAADGSYTLRNVVPGSGYTLRFRDAASGALYGTPVPNEAGTSFTPGQASPANPGGAIVAAGVLQGLDILPGATVAQQSLPLDPTGIVYDAITRMPLPGATVTLTGPSGFAPATQLIGGTANVTQTVGASGVYQFLLAPGAPAGTYSLVVSPPSGGRYAPQSASTLIPPCAGPHAVGATPNPFVVQTSNAPPPQGTAISCAPGTNSTTYYLSFTLSPGVSAPVVNNHLPVDPVLAGSVQLTKTTPLVNISAGQSVPYTITATNTLSGTISGIAVIDTTPAGFQYRVGSGLMDGHRLEPTVTGHSLTWGALSFAAGETKTFQLVLTAGAGVQPGEYVNRAVANNTYVNQPVSGVATATVRIVPDPTFDCPDLIGKVFDDSNGNGLPDPGEKGIAGVRLVTAQGLLVTTDADGRYHIACPVLPNPQIGSNFVVKVDERTLPSGYRLTSENPETVHLTAGKVSKLNFGAAISHVVRVEVDAGAFDGDSLRPEVTDRLAGAASSERGARAKGGAHLVVRLIYVAHDESESTIAARVRALRAASENIWRTAADGTRPSVEEEVVRSVVPRASGGAR